MKLIEKIIDYLFGKYLHLQVAFCSAVNSDMPERTISL